MEHQALSPGNPSEWLSVKSQKSVFFKLVIIFFIYFYLKADSVTSGGGVQEDIKEEDEEEEEDEKKDDVFEPDKKLIGQVKKAEPSTPPGT